MKKALKVLTASAVMAGLLGAPAMAAPSTDIYYNDKLLDTTQPVLNVDGRTMLAFRDLFENLDGDVNWDAEKRVASVTYGKTTIHLLPDNGAAQINGVPQALDVGPQIINDRVYLPLRFVAQSLGGTVDYTQAKDGSATIQIYTIDSEQNFAKKNGKVTSILRTTSAPVNSVQPNKETQAAYNTWKQNNAVYFMDDHNNLVEVQSYDTKIQVNVIDFAKANVESKTYDAGVLYPALTSVAQNGKTYTVGINETGGRYLGTGTPSANNYQAVLDTTAGNISVLSASNNNKVVRFNASTDTASVTTSGETGKVLDLVQRFAIPEDSSYAVASNGSYGFMMDGQLLIIENDNDVMEDIQLTRNAGDCQIFTNGDKFVAVAVENSLHHPEIYAAVYNKDGSIKYHFHNVSKLSKVEKDETFYDYNNLQIKDMKLFGDTVYILAKTNMDYYIVTYNIKDNTSTKERLTIKEKTYDGFIYTMDDVKLFASDDNYFYLRDVK